MLASRTSALLLLFAGCLAAQRDPVARLGASIEAGQIQPRFDRERGYLPWLLEVLKIPVESQMLVFSKTSIQGLMISPDNPRALYFNDSVAIGGLKSGNVEIAATDPTRGILFYLLDQNPFHAASRSQKVPPFSLRPDCQTCCHGSKQTGLAQMLVLSVTPNQYGLPLKQLGIHNTDSRTPMEQLWGGWFVTGQTAAHHSGNFALDARGKPLALHPPGASDIVALLVFQHQMRIMNLIARVAVQGKGIEELAGALTFTGDAPLPSPVKGASGFSEKFSAQGPLREFDLQTRLMRYRCSYMIFSEPFQALPAATKKAVFERIRATLRNDPETLAFLK